MNNNSNSTRDSKSVTTTVRSHGHSVSPSVTSSTASWLDERIAKERKGVGVNETTSVDREAKNKARNSVGKPGTLREPIDLRDSYNQEASRRVPSRSGSNRQEEGTGTSVPPPKPSRGSNKMVNNSVRSALEDLEKDVLRSLPNTSSKATNFPESLNNSIQEGRTSAKLQTMEQDVVSKAGAKTTTFALTKRLVPSKLNRMEKDATDKASAIGSAASATITQRANAFGVDMEAKARARSKPTGAVVVTKRLNQMEADMAAKQKARGTSSTSAPTKSLNQLELDMAAKARAGSTSINQLQADLAAKAQARCGHLSTKQLSRDFDLAGGNLISRLSEEQDEIIAYKTGAASSSSEHPPGVQAIARPKGNASKMLNPKEGYLTSKGGGVISLEGPYSNGIRKGLDFDMDDFSDDEEAGGLAVAVAVKDYEDDDVFIPAAVEYDPDAKPPMYKNRRFRMYGILGCILLIILLACTIGILAFQEKKGATPTFQIPTSAPTCERCSIGIEEQLELEVGSEKLYDPSTSEFLAKEWIINEDPLQLLPMDANLIQRFLLATFYFETHQLGDWLSCNRQSSDDEDETCSFDRIINIYPLEYEGVPSIRWLSSEHECQWAGINCDELNQTRIIDLPGQDIQGTFPAVLTRLPYVQTITLAWNNFIGQLPDSIGNMKHLLNFEVQYNQFTGNIPLTWSNAKNLQLVNFGGNMLSGQMPTEVGYLRNIKGMFLYENMLTGTFPDEFAQLSLLTYARLQRNLLSGTIPTFLGDMRLNELWINRNPVKGTIPSELGKLSNHIFDLRLFATHLEGTIPEDIYDLTSLWRLDLNEANFTGTISSKVGNLQSLSVFRINNNFFSGTLPSELDLLSNLNTVQFDHNQFNGTVPSGMCDNLAPDGSLELLQADCLVDPVSGSTMITCECCTVCCAPGWDECVGNNDEM